MSVFSKQKIKDFFIYGLGQGINIVSPLLILPYIIIICGEEGLGKVGVGMSMALIINGIVDYGSYINGVKEISINRDNKQVLEQHFKAIYFSKLMLLLLMLFFVGIIILTVPFFAREKELYFFSFLIVIGQFINPTWFFQGIENFKWISIVNVVSKLLYIGLFFAFVKQKEDYIYVNLFFGLGAIIGNCLGLLWIIKKYGFSLNIFKVQPALTILKTEFSFSVSQLFLSMYQYAPIILISYLGGDFVAGQFRVIDQIVSIFKTYLNMFFYFVYANICYVLNQEIKRGINVWKQYNGVNFLFLSTLLFVFYYHADFILRYFKIDEIQLKATAEYFRMALIVPFLVSISQPLRQLMFAFNENKIYIRITIATTLLNFILLVFLTKQDGLKGTFLSIILIELLIIVLYYGILLKHFRQNLKTANGI